MDSGSRRSKIPAIHYPPQGGNMEKKYSPFGCPEKGLGYCLVLPGRYWIPFNHPADLLKTQQTHYLRSDWGDLG